MIPSAFNLMEFAIYFIFPVIVGTIKCSRFSKTRKIVLSMTNYFILSTIGTSAKHNAPTVSTPTLCEVNT